MKKAMFVIAMLLTSMFIVKIRLAVSEEATIQGLIDNASPYDTVYLPSGTYYELLQVTKPLTIIGAPTTIDANHSGACMYIHLFYPYSRESVTVKNVVVQNGQDGFYLDLCSDCLIENCTIENMHFGISMDDARNQTIKNNVFRNNHVGIHFYGIGNSFINNWFENSDSNAIVLFSSNNTFEGNTFLNNCMGIYVATYSNYNTFYNNTFIKSTWANMQVRLSHSNFIYYNNFFKGTGAQVIFETTDETNFWDNGTVGNYWSDYKGVDLNGNGVGDTSYAMTENNVDHYPLMTDPSPLPSLRYTRSTLVIKSPDYTLVIRGPYYTYGATECYIVSFGKHASRLISGD